GLKVLLNDPPRADEGEEGFCSLDTLAEQCNILTFHTPLIREGKYKTDHLADSTFFQKLQQVPYLINTSRGEVVDTEALLTAMNKGLVKSAVIDVWENEPHISQELLDKVFIGTPHIAGYSADGKANATRMVLEAFCRFFHKQADFHITLPDNPNQTLSQDENVRVLQLYNPHKDCEELRAHPELFEQLRGDYHLRRE
ncbi:NAD(P)-dependent oxidoreductase, partial [Phocaeicola plebeius]